jgi:hypothetical protein
MAFAKTALVLALTGAAVAGCSGVIETRKVTPEAMNNTDDWVKGVIIYQPALFAEISSKTTLVEGGKLKGSSADKPPACVPVQSEKTVALPDLKNPYQIRYSPGLFDSNTFGVQLQLGTLTSVNGNVSGAMNGAPAAGGSSSTSGGLSAVPIPTPFGIPLSAPAAPPPQGTFGPVTLEHIQFGSHTASVRRVQLRPSLPACNDGPVILGYRRLVMP